MRTFLIALLLGFIIGSGVTWYVVGKRGEPVPPAPTATQSSAQRTIEDARQVVSEKADSLRTAIDAKLDIWHLKSDDIKAELTAKGKVVRQQTREVATEIKDATKDSAITADIKAKYALDKDVSALSVSVSTTDGVVTLSGSASSYNAISKAMLIAMDTEGVRQVVSTIQVK